MAAETVVIPSKRFDELAQRLVASGRFNSPSEVLEAAIDALEREECDEEAKGGLSGAGAGRGVFQWHSGG